MRAEGEIWACEWEDAHYNSGEFPPEEISHKPVNYISVGILVRDDATGFATATDVSESGLYRGINFVPAAMIVRKWKVGAIEPRKKRAPKVRTVQAINDETPATEK